MTAELLKSRLKSFAYRCVNVCDALPKKKISSVVEGQLLRSSFSVAANYRAACRAQSTAQFIAKLNIALEEMDESEFWIEVITELNLVSASKMQDIQKESTELVKILSASKNTIRQKMKLKQS